MSSCMENPHNLTQKPKKLKSIESNIVQKIIFECEMLGNMPTYLILMRNPEVCKKRKDKWDLPGGKFDTQDNYFNPDALLDNENLHPLQRSIIREVYEETQYVIDPQNLIQIYLGSEHKKVLTIAIIYLCKLENDFVPLLSKEHTEFCWVELNELRNADFGDDIHINTAVKNLSTSN